MKKLKYKRVLLKMSGESLRGNKADSLDPDFLTFIAMQIKAVNRMGVELAIVVGGGKTARNAIAKCKKRGENEAACDYAGIEASRYNASVVSQAMGIEPLIPVTIKEAKKLLKTEGIVLMGGTEPGHSTDAVASILGEYMEADLLIKVSNIKGVYDKDPKKHKDAKLLKKLSIDDLTDIVNDLSQSAGNYRLFDMLAVKMLKRSRIKTIVLEGHNLSNMKAAIGGKSFVGTIIQ